MKIKKNSISTVDELNFIKLDGHNFLVGINSELLILNWRFP